MTMALQSSMLISIIIASQKPSKTNFIRSRKNGQPMLRYMCTFKLTRPIADHFWTVCTTLLSSKSKITHHFWTNPCAGFPSCAVGSNRSTAEQRQRMHPKTQEIFKKRVDPGQPRGLVVSPYSYKRPLQFHDIISSLLLLFHCC